MKKKRLIARLMNWWRKLDEDQRLGVLLAVVVVGAAVIALAR